MLHCRPTVDFSFVTNSCCVASSDILVCCVSTDEHLSVHPVVQSLLLAETPQHREERVSCVSVPACHSTPALFASCLIRGCAALVVGFRVFWSLSFFCLQKSFHSSSLTPLCASSRCSSGLKTAGFVLFLVSVTCFLALLSVNSDMIIFHYLFAGFNCVQVSPPFHPETA